MALRSLTRLSVPLLSFLSLTPLVRSECYIAAYGLVGKQDGWSACPGTALSGGIETCCMPGSECGEDSICRVPGGGSNEWYVAGCTDPNYSASVCNKACVSYTQTYIQWDDSSQDWMCCGSGGCNGTVTDDTFSGVSPQDWQVITGDSTTTSEAPSPSPAPTTTTVAPADSSPAEAETTSTEAAPTTSGSNPTSNEVTSTSAAATTSRAAKTTALPNSADFKPSPLHGTTFAGHYTSAIAGSASSTSSPSTQDSSDDTSSTSGLSTGAKAGIGAAIGVAGLALIVGIVAIFMLRKHRQRKEESSDEVRMKHETLPPYPTSASMQSPYSSDTYGASTVSELPTNPPVFEVGGAENELGNRKNRRHW